MSAVFSLETPQNAPGLPQRPGPAQGQVFSGAGALRKRPHAPPLGPRHALPGSKGVPRAQLSRGSQRTCVGSGSCSQAAQDVLSIFWKFLCGLFSPSPVASGTAREKGFPLGGTVKDPNPSCRHQLS